MPDRPFRTPILVYRIPSDAEHRLCFPSQVAKLVINTRIFSFKFDLKEVRVSLLFYCYEITVSPNYAYNTARTYISLFEGYMNYYADREFIDLDEGDVRKYLQHLVQEGKSDSYLNQAVNAIKFYYEVVMGMPNRFYSIERPRKQEKLPEVLSKEEIKRMIRVTQNLKHRCIISLLYSAGLRRGEVLNLKIEDIDSQRMLIKVVAGKGSKDRYTLLGKTVLHLLRIYYREYRPKEYLFEGEHGGKYSATTLLKIVKAAARKAKIKKRVYPHILRHSFATAPAARSLTGRRYRFALHSDIVRPPI